MKMQNKGRPKVALIQNRLQKGGRLQVAIHMIKILNDHFGIKPDFITLRSGISTEDIQNSYNSKLNFRIRVVSIDLKIPFEWNIIYFNKVVGRYLSEYDLVINHNNTSFLLNCAPSVISYVHFPRKFRVTNTKKDIHFPDGKSKSIWDYKTDFLRLCSICYRLFDKRIKDDLTIANSEFTLQTLKNCYSLEDIPTEVLYPPVSLPLRNPGKKQRNKVVSLGRFSADKRQLEQIKIAEEISDLEFHLIGFVNSKEYYFQCQAYLEHNNIPNVHLHANLAYSEVQNHLEEASFFLHSLQNEPFGITTVQAMSRGCIPVVHNSGGQKEIVHLDSLRYENIMDAINKLKILMSKSSRELEDIRMILTRETEKFGIKKFESRFTKILERFIDRQILTKD